MAWYNATDMGMEWHSFYKPRLFAGMGWALLGSSVIVGATAFLGRAALNLRAALTEKPDIGIYMLLPDEGIRNTTLLRSTDTERHYIAETRDGSKLIILRKNGEEWGVIHIERLREASPLPAGEG